MWLDAALIDETKSLNVLLGWTPTPPPYPTRLVEACEAALAAPLGSLSASQIRMLIGQGFGLEILLPKAFDLLRENPLVSVEFYEGDLLCTCLKAKQEFWADHDALWMELNSIVESLHDTMEQVNRDFKEFQARNPYGAKL
ncbi:contact-dependent growth inhibition system immunity protein [Mesorhizobium sp. IMUNJ 23232]|uniref:contact-dependent growth inhibition system immunity protein n=1 Tax=Mesorhizobium sp. IMUNJ 23232 TaxID=3376064 RepID=UPI0037AE1140